MEDLSRTHGTKTPRSFQHLINTGQAPLANSPLPVWQQLGVVGRLFAQNLVISPPQQVNYINYPFSFPGSPPKGASADVPVQQLPEGFLLQLAPAHSHLHPQLLQHLCHVSVWE